MFPIFIDGLCIKHFFIKNKDLVFGDQWKMLQQKQLLARSLKKLIFLKWKKQCWLFRLLYRDLGNCSSWVIEFVCTFQALAGNFWHVLVVVVLCGNRSPMRIPRSASTLISIPFVGITTTMVRTACYTRLVFLAYSIVFFPILPNDSRIFTRQILHWDFIS